MSNRATLHWPCGDTQGLSVLQPRQPQGLPLPDDQPGQPHRSALTGQTPVGCRGNPGGCLGQGHGHRNRNVARWSAGFVGGLVCGFFGCFARPGLASRFLPTQERRLPCSRLSRADCSGWAQGAFGGSATAASILGLCPIAFTNCSGCPG